MALGQERNFNNSNKRVDTTYYSRLHFNNYSDHKRLNITYSAGLMHISIAVSPDGNSPAEDKITVHLTGNKAKILLEQFKLFEKAISESNISTSMAFGVQTGMSDVRTVIAVHTTADNGKGITIAKVNSEGGINERYEYEFAKNYNFGLTWTNFDSMQIEKNYHDNLDYEMLKEAIEQFAITCSGAAGYNAVDLARYDIGSFKNRIESVMDKLGVPVQRNNNSNFRQNSSRSYFDNGSSDSRSQASSASNHKTLDDIDDEYLSNEDDE